MKKFTLLATFVIVAFFALSTVANSGDQAAPEEVVQKVKEAAQVLSKEGDKGLEEFNKKDGKWVWKDTYVFVFDCSKGNIVAHPVQPHLVGKNMMGLKDVKGNLFFVSLCEVAKNSKGGWVEYWWPKPGEQNPSRKVSYMLKVEGTSYEVGAGIYDEKTSVEDLNKSIK